MTGEIQLKDLVVSKLLRQGLDIFASIGKSMETERKIGSGGTS
jgi:hypothetical protein